MNKIMEFDFRAMPIEEKKKLSEWMFRPLNSPQDVRNWVKLFLGLELPLEITDPESTSTPLDAIWQIYNTFKHNTGDINPGYILMSCREGMKCTTQGTEIIKENGFCEIENIKEGDVIWTGFSWQKVLKTFDEGFKPGLKIALEGGWASTGTPIHRYWCLREGKEQWIAGKDLNLETDLICLGTNTPLKSFERKIDQKQYDIGYFLGLLIGDGGLSLMDKYHKFVLTNTDNCVNDFFEKFCKRYFPDNKICISKNGIERTVFGIKNIDLLKSWGLTNSYSWEKAIPSFAWSDYDAMKGFIAGVFDTDGCWDKKGDCFFEMTAGKLLDEIQIALTAFGIESKVRHNKKLYGMQKHLVSRLTIGQTEAAKFEKLGIIFKAKKAQKHKINKIPNCKDSLPINQICDLLAVCKKYSHCKIKNRKYKKPRTDQDLYYDGVTSNKLRKMCDWMNENYDCYGISVISEKDMAVVRRYEKILKNKWKKFTVEDVGEQYFYDLEVENDHSYWSNGVISHNTVSVAIMEMLLLLHFQLDIGHAAAVEEQSAVALGYINGFILQISPLIEVAGWVPVSENKRLIKYQTPQGKFPFIKIVICNPKGMNSLHSNVLFLDELDLADPKALTEGKFITGFSKGIHGIKVYLSTRKYAFGNMAKAIENASAMNFKILRWNILDVTERCPASRHKPEGSKEDRYVAKNLPLVQITPFERDLLPDSEKMKYDHVKDAHEGCRSCLIFPVCKMRLSIKPESATGGFYKPISTIIQAFRENEPDAAEAQLLCWKPGSEGLVYPRFNSTAGSGNVLTLKMAYEILTGEECKKSYVTELDLLSELHKAQVPIYAGVDWGYTHDAVIMIVAKLDNGEIWVIDCFAAPGLEFSDLLVLGISYRDKYNIQKWFCDQAAPANIKSFNKNGMKSPKFTKDVMGGIESIRSKIVSGSGQRLFKIVETVNTKKVISAIIKHRFKLDGQGNVTTEPDDERGIADICDALRYVGQNLFPVRGSQKPEVSWTDVKLNDTPLENPTHREQMIGEVSKRLVETDELKGGTGRKGGFHWNI